MGIGVMKKTTKKKKRKSCLQGDALEAQEAQEAQSAAEADAGRQSPPETPAEQPSDGGGLSEDEIRATLAAITPAQAAALKIDIPDVYGVDARLAEIESKTDEIEQRYMDGGIGESERLAELRKLNRERDDLNREKARAETVAYFVQQQAHSAQQAILDELVRGAKSDGIDYEADADARVEFNAALKTAEALPRLAGKPPGDIYAAAHRMVLAARGIAPAPAAAPAAASQAQGGARRAAPPVPPSIRNLPTAATQTQGSGLDDVLRHRKGTSFDDTWGRMTEEQRRAYLDS